MKNINNIIIALFLSSLCLVTGCSTMANAREEKGKGVAYIYEGSFDHVWAAVPKAVTSIRSIPLRIAESNPAEAYIYGQAAPRSPRNVVFGISGTLTIPSEGQSFLIFVDKVSDDRTSVEIVPERAFTTKLMAVNWPPRIHGKLSETLKRVE